MGKEQKCNNEKISQRREESHCKKWASSFFKLEKTIVFSWIFIYTLLCMKRLISKEKYRGK